MVDNKVYKRILCVSDLHAPYNHPNSLEFIRGCNKAFKPDCVINMGDELDFSASSYHESSTELYNPARELEEGKKGERKWENVGRGCFKRAGEEDWKEVEAWMGWEVAKEGR